jgi:hypothetical protein
VTPTDILDKVKNALTGETARFIGYGAAIVLVGLVAVLNALGVTRFGEGLSLTDALIGTTAAVTTVAGLVESIRHYVFSANTVNAIVEEQDGDTT